MLHPYCSFIVVALLGVFLPAAHSLAQCGPYPEVHLPPGFNPHDVPPPNWGSDVPVRECNVRESSQTVVTQLAQGVTIYSRACVFEYGGFAYLSIRGFVVNPNGTYFNLDPTARRLVPSLTSGVGQGCFDIGQFSGPPNFYRAGGCTSFSYRGTGVSRKLAFLAVQMSYYKGDFPFFQGGQDWGRFIDIAEYYP